MWFCWGKELRFSFVCSNLTRFGALKLVFACLPTLSQSALSSHLCSLLHDHRTHSPPHLWPETNFQAVGNADNKIFKLKLKQQAQTQRGRQAAKCAKSSITPGPGNLVSQVCPLYSQSQELTFHYMKEDLSPLTSYYGQYVFCFCRIVLHFSFIEDVLSLHFVSAWEVQNRKVNPIVG